MPAECHRDQVSLHCFMLIMSESPVFTAPADRCNKLRSTGLRIGQGGTPGTAFMIPLTALLPGKGADTISCGIDLPTLP